MFANNNFEKDEIERLLLAYSPKFQEILDIAEGQIREGKGMKHADFWQDVKSEIPEAG